MNPIKEEERQLLRAHLQNEPTERLLEIWQSADRAEWTEEALEVAAELLQERLGSLPPRLDPPMEADEEGMATYHDPDKVFRIAKFARWASWLALALGPFQLLVQLLWVTVYRNEITFVILQALLSSLIPTVAGVALCIVLRAVSEWSYLLLDIEDNTHRAAEAAEKSRETE